MLHFGLLVLGVLLVGTGGAYIGYRLSRARATTKPTDSTEHLEQDPVPRDAEVSDARVKSDEPQDGPAVFSPFLEIAADGRKEAIPTERCRLGRTAENDIMVKDPSVSRHHAEIELTEDGHYEITDLGSMNGMYVNNKRCRHSRLAHNDKVELGDALMYFKLEATGPNEQELGQTRTLVLKPGLGDMSLDSAIPTQRLDD